MLPASFAACVPAFIATPTSACASAGASFVPSPVMATSWPPACSLRISASLASGVASARKSSTPDSAAIAAAVSGLSPVIMTVRIPAARSWAKRSLDAVLDDVLELDHPEHPRALGDHERRRAAARDPVDVLGQIGRERAAAVLDVAPYRVGRALAVLETVQIDAAHARLGGEGDEVRIVAREVAAAQAVLLLREHDDRASLGRLVGERAELRRLRQLLLARHH